MSLSSSSRVSFRALGLGRGSVAVAALALTALGCVPANAASGPTATTDPNGFLTLTGAPGYADPATPALRTVPVSTSAGLTAALGTAQPGDQILLATGTYTGPFSIVRFGTRAHPIVVKPAAGAVVTLTASLPYPSCAATGPDQDRTLDFGSGANHWVVEGLSISGGVKISGVNSSIVQDWQAAKIASHDWQARRSVPGASSYNPSKTALVPSFFSSVIGAPVAGAEDVQILHNTITRKGIYGRLVRYSVVSGNTIAHVACGTGPGIWLSNYSHGSVVTGNDVSDVAHSTAKHFMQEGIRLGNGSDYNVVAGNFVHNLAVGGRAFTTDQDSSFNLITRNTADTVDIGFNEQQSGWGNTWTLNHVSHATVAGYSIRMEDGKFTAPSENSSSYHVTMDCNTSISSAVDFQAGAVSHGTFTRNAFATYKVNKQLAGYWGSVGDTWNGAPTAPTTGVSSPGTTTC